MPGSIRQKYFLEFLTITKYKNSKSSTFSNQYRNYLQESKKRNILDNLEEQKNSNFPIFHVFSAKSASSHIFFNKQIFPSSPND